MPNPYPLELRERAVRAYESSDETYLEVAERFAVGPATLQRWVRRQRETGALDPLAKGGGWVSPVDVGVLHALVRERPDRTTDELTRVYNGGCADGSGPSIQHPARPAADRICLQKKRTRPAEQDRASVQAERAAFRVGSRR